MKKITSFILTLVLCACISTIFCYAFDIPDNSESCTINKNETYSYSNYVIGTWKYYGAQCYTSSKQMTIIAQYYDGSSKKFLPDKTEHLTEYSNFMDHETSKHPASLSWRVYLEPRYSTAGAYGRAYIRNK